MPVRAMTAFLSVFWPSHLLNQSFALLHLCSVTLLVLDKFCLLLPWAMLWEVVAVSVQFCDFFLVFSNGRGEGKQYSDIGSQQYGMVWLHGWNTS